MIERKYDIIVFGATGYTGKLVAEYLALHAPPGLRWALSGRSMAKLEAIRKGLCTLQAGLSDLPLIEAEAKDRSTLDPLVASTRVVCTTVGPYMLYGRELVAACAEAGTHYCDLTGETPFVREAIDLHHATAVRTGAKLVCCCGFDSIPSDLGVWLLRELAREGGQGLSWVKYFAGESGGGFSGGTIASILNMVEASERDPSLRGLLRDPHSLDPLRGKPYDPSDSDQLGVRYDRDMETWTAPFVMAAINTRIVRRSHALCEGGYGPDFRYAESMSFGKGPKGFALASAMTAALGAFAAALVVPQTRKLLARRVLPAPGEGPTKEAREKGFFVVRFLAETSGPGTPRKLYARVEGRSDPGYGETAKMLGESALCLALDASHLPSSGGVLTPATAMGTRLIERLRSAKMVFRAAEQPIS